MAPIKSLFLCLLVGLTLSAAAQDRREGTYEGVLKAGGQELTLYFDVTTGDPYTVALRVPDQTPFPIPASNVSVRGADWVIEFAAIGARWRGEMERGRMRGSWEQGGGAFPLLMRRTGAVVAPEAPNRPQTPQAPFPYAIEPAIFRGATDAITLFGTLTRPRGNGSYPAVLLISGSGPQDRDETLFDHKPFHVIADHLTRAGFAVLRYDERGVGQSTGRFETATTTDFAADARKGLEWLAKQPQITADQLFILGHSEGGAIAPMLADAPGVAGHILLAAPVFPIADLMAAQNKAAAKLAGAPRRIVDQAEARAKALFSRLRDYNDIDQARRGLRRWVQDSYGADQAESVLSSLTPWMLGFAKLNPTETLAAVPQPVLALFGEKDFQVAPEPSMAALSGMIAADKITASIVPDANHLFQTAETGSASEYARIEETIQTQVLARITDWLLAQTAD